MVDWEFVDECLKKIHSHPDDKTPFLELSKFFRLKEMHETSYYFGKKYLKHHPDDLNIHNELSIVSYYVNEIDQGYKSCEEILLSLDTTPFPKDLTNLNLLFYINPITISKKIPITIPFGEGNGKKEKGKEIEKDKGDKGCEREENRKPMNTSIIKVGDNYIANVRVVNYSFDKNGKWMIFGKNAITENYILKISPQYKILNEKFHKVNDDILNKYIINPDILWKGLEDIRIFLYKGEYWFTCVSPGTHPRKFTQVCLGKFSDDLTKFDFLLPLIGPDNNRNQKNWLPFVFDGEIVLIYSHFPFILLKPILEGENRGKCEIWKERKIQKKLSPFRGSFSPIPYKHGYLYMVHQAVFKDNFYRYISRFVYMNSSLDEITLSSSFYFFHIGVEYCAGATWNERGNLVATISRMDNESWICEIEKEEIERKFKDFSLTL